MLTYAPTAKCPSLHDGRIAVWESLAIIEFVAELFPEKPIWPRSKAARAEARSLASEMHAGFQALRNACPMNFFRTPEAHTAERSGESRRRADRGGFCGCEGGDGKAGPFLFGRFSAADAMFAPVVNRLHAYAIPVLPGRGPIWTR